MYAIINVKTGKFVFGTDRRKRFANGTYAQRTSKDCALTYEWRDIAEMDLKIRGMSKNYKVVEVEIRIKEDV